jgi:hypothetical protein
MNRTNFARLSSKLAIRQRASRILVLKKRSLKVLKSTAVGHSGQPGSNLELELEIAGNIQLR